MAGPDHSSNESSTASALCEHMDELVEGLRKQVPAALKHFDEEAIHHARVATRRLKAAIDLLEPVLTKEHRKPFTAIGRKLRRRLGPLRDLDVMIGHLQSIQKIAKHKPAAQWLENRLNRSREHAREDSAKNQSPNRVLARLGTWWGLREEVLEARDAVTSLLASSVHLQLDCFSEQAQLLAAKAAGEIPADARQDPHELRIAGKALRYTLEMAKMEGHPLPTKVAKVFKKMQESLGLWHDYVVLTERAMKESLEELLAHHNADLQRQVLELSRLTLERAGKELQKFSAMWKTEGPQLTATIRGAFPLSRSLAEHAPEVLTESKTDPDPSDSDAVTTPAEQSPADPAAA